MTKKTKGFILAILGALCWGIQGPISQFLFQEIHISTSWIMGVKMLFAGIFLTIFSISTKGIQYFVSPLKNKKDRFQLLMFSLFGITLVQYMYFLTIKESDAGIATILQSLGTIIIIILSIFVYKQMPKKKELLAVIIAIIGTWLLVTKPNALFTINISRKALIFGLLLAFAGAMQTMLPVSLLKKYDSVTLLGYAMLTGGIIFTIINPFWINYPPLTLEVLLGVGFIVIFGTSLSYLCFTSSLNYISATEAGLLASVEPASATLGAVIFLGTIFSPNQIIGGILILSTVFILAIKE